jgi:glycosyltransferase 2 family protein
MKHCGRMSEIGVDRGAAGGLRIPYGRRLFANLAEEPRARRITDILAALAGTVAAGAVSLIAVPPSRADRRIGHALTVASSVDLFRHVVTGSFAAWAIALLLTAAWRRRFGLVRDIAVAAVLVLGLAVAAAVLAHGGWVSGMYSGFVGSREVWAPLIALAVPAAVVFTASPHLSKPARRVGLWLLALSAIALALGGRPPTTVISGWLLATVAAAVVHIAFGSCRGRPSLADVQIALGRIGVDARSVGAADRQSHGVFLVNATDQAGDPLLVKIYGRDAKDTRLVVGVLRRIWFRDSGAPVSFGRAEQVANEAFLTLYVQRAGVLTLDVFAAGSTPQKDALLVLRRRGTVLRELPHAWTDDTAKALWAMLARLREIGVSSGQVDAAHLLVDAGAVGVHDLRGGALTTDDDDLRRDEAQALVSTALALGPQRAVSVACQAIGSDRLAAALPFVQAPALTPGQRADIKERKFELDKLRSTAAETAGVELPALQQLQRVTWRSVLQLVLMVGAVSILANQVAGLDFAALADQLRGATWWLVGLGALIAQAPRLAQAASCLGASPRPLPLKPVYFLQLALAYIGLVVPASAARIAINVRFFQRQGLAAGSALAVGAIDGVAGFIVEAVLLVGLLALTPRTVHLDLSNSSDSGLRSMLLIIVVVAVVIGAALLLIPRRRRQVIGWVRGLLSDGYRTLRGLQSPRRLALLFGGNLASDLLFAASLGTFAQAFGTRVQFVDLVVIIISVSLLAGLLPIPGGIGVTEGGLTLGLVSAGMPEEAAFAAVILYRLATYYVPPLWGFFALRWLERNNQL